MSASSSVQGPYAKPPKSTADGDDEDAPGVTDTRGDRQGRGVDHALDRRDALHQRPKKGQTTVYYEVSGSGELSGDLVIGPLVNAALGGKVTGKARVAVTVD